MPDKIPGRFFLNPLKEGDRVLAAPIAGRWTSDEITKDFLIKYSQDIHLGQSSGESDSHEELDLRLVHNVPSVFARPIQFNLALGDRSHPLHQTVTAQWRGLLATFALRLSIGATIKVSDYTVPPLPADSVVNQSPAMYSQDRNISVILRSQLPKKASDWDHWWMFHCGGELIGATSPWTIVYTPAQYRAPGIVPWQDDDGLFVDPIKFFDPKGKGEPREVLGLLHRWVNLLLLRFEDPQCAQWGFRNGLSDKAKAVRWAVEQWQADLRKYADPALANVPVAAESAVPEDPYAAFLTPLRRLDGGARQGGDLLAKTDRPNEKLIVFSRKGIPSGTQVYDGVFGREVDLERLEKSGIGNEGWQTVTGRAVPVQYRVVEDAFFSPKLLEIGLEPAAFKCGSTRYALPLTADFFRFFSLFDSQEPDERRVKLDMSEDAGEVQVRLQIPLLNGGFMKVEKTYGREDITKFPDLAIPVLALWPDFGVEDWTENYASFSVEPHPQGKAKLLAAPILEDGTLLERTVEEGTEEKPKQSSCRVWCAPTPVIGFALYMRDATGSVSLGVVVRGTLEKPTRIQPLRRWDVGVDFGTSNTQVTVRAPNQDSRALTFERRTQILTSAPVANIPAVTRNLFPSRKDPVPPRPLPTALRIADATRCPDPGTDTKWAELNFGPERNFFATNLVPNVKWSTPGGPANNDSIRQYLTGLLRAVLCEARAGGVGVIGFRWSYPRSLPTGAFGAMSSFWNVVGATINATQKISLDTPISVTESEAVCRYFRTQPLAGLPVNASSLSVAIDVGGGSSDVAFWLAGQLVDISSFRIAANDILVPAARFPGFAEQLAAACGAGGVVVEALRERPGVVINALLTQAKDANRKPCDLQRPGDHPLVHALFGQLDMGSAPWFAVRSAIYLYFMGLTYYAGLHARDIVARYRDLGTGQSAETGDGVSAAGRVPLIQHRQIGVYFGGLGSSLLTWISSDSALLRSVLEFAFKKGLMLDHPDGNNFDVKPSGAAIAPNDDEHPKEEVVQGLMVDDLALDRQGGNPPRGFDTSTILCEIGWKDAQGQPVEWNRRLTAEKLRELKAPRNHDSGYMAQFLGNVLLKKAEKLVIDNDGLGRLEIDGAHLEHLMRDVYAGDQAVLQPVFGHELKTVLDQYLRAPGK